MDRIEKIHKLIDQIGKLAKEEFPELTRIEIVVKPDGYAEFDATEWDQNSHMDDRKYRYLFKQCRCSLERGWSEDGSKGMNEYLGKHGSLLREDEE